ncbi:sugar-transfer associated ATP-grasp domain-containing protein [Maribacter sp. BPC-D8]|uniref:sugar-transfer associated ATP-grasp domain-containing protein n=1 Tax=Maribacter sp. BPC-D8 TaxID=3053613 RepID=UPI002B49064F|nr:sugar-transfer associated ATP-grasp domain-containing protein [Maribacter sp. BPC-D8]WRI28321.1 sugar-transfer associated ATP-grasp domain-containing protein [Maribacter sp. BPC-D8]
MTLIKQIAATSIKKLENLRYHKISTKIAYDILTSLKEEKGNFPIELKKKADNYAIEVLGWKGFAPWLYVYSHFTGEFKEGWIPDNFYGKVVIPKIQGAYGRVSMLKPLTNRLFDKNISPDLGYFINGTWFDTNYSQIPETDIQKIFFADTDIVIVKLDTTYQGKGIYVLTKYKFNISKLNKLGDFVIQKFIKQHEFFNSYTSKSVATIRLTTVVEISGDISLRAAYLRLGRSGDTHVQSVNHIRIPIEMIDGKLYELGYLPNWHQIKTYPDSKTTFSDKEIPNFETCVNLVLSLHKKMPMVKAIGWDVIIDSNNQPVVMEWNGYSNDIKFSEATQGPCFSDLNWDKIKITNTQLAQKT